MSGSCPLLLNFIKTDSMRTLTHADWLQYQWLHNLVRSPIGRKSPLWTSQLSLTGTTWLRAKTIRALHKFKLIHFVTRMLDWFRRGDNFVVILQKL